MGAVATLLVFRIRIRLRQIRVAGILAAVEEMMMMAFLACPTTTALSAVIIIAR
jgi:hypothetical protein